MILTLKDFDRLACGQMEFKNKNWAVQIDRFDELPNFEHEFIYWFENSAALFLATKYLDQENFTYELNYDLKYDQPILTTDYAGSWIIEPGVENLDYRY